MMRPLKFLIALSLIPLISACASTPEPQIITQTEYISREIPTVNRPAPVQLSDVQWYVVNEENLDEFIARFRETNGQVVFMAISVRDYEKLALNIQELRRYINQQREIIVYYENAVMTTPTESENTQ